MDAANRMEVAESARLGATLRQPPRWFYAVLATCAVVLAASGFYASVSIAKTATRFAAGGERHDAARKRWSAIDARTVFDAETGAICDVLDNSCYAPPVNRDGSPAPGSRR